MERCWHLFLTVSRAMDAWAPERHMTPNKANMKNTGMINKMGLGCEQGPRCGLHPAKLKKKKIKMPKKTRKKAPATPQ